MKNEILQLIEDLKKQHTRVDGYIQSQKDYIKDINGAIHFGQLLGKREIIDDILHELSKINLVD
jgi:hypothetical protein